MMTSSAALDRRPYAALWAGFWALALCLESVRPAWGQRRRAEPEANPQFQQEVQGGRGQAGQPLDPSEEAPPAASAFPSRAVQGVQIGAAPTAPALPPAPTNPLETRVTVRVKEAPLATFLDTISAQAKVNFIITEGLEQKRVTAFLQNVTVREALQILLEIKGLTYQQIGRSNTYVVSPRSKSAPNKITRIYTLSHIPLIPISKDVTIQGAATTGIGITPIAPPPAAGGAAPSDVGSAGAASGPVSDIAILNVLRSVLSREGGVQLDPRTNAMIVTDIPEVFPQVEQIIAELDKKVPQILIEAQIVEINSDRSQDLGLEWGGPKGELATFTAGARSTTFPLNLPKDLGHTHFFDPITAVGNSLGEPVAPFPSNALRMSVLDLTQLTVVLRALVARTEARFLGKPKVLTLNNKTALIQIARDQAIGRQASQVSVGSQGTQSVTAAERKGTGLVLRVTPQVNKEGYVTLLVEPSFTNVIESSISTAASPTFDPVSRAVSTLVRVKNGQTLVLGGLLQSRETKIVRKVPFFGYIPLVGWLFTSTSNRRENTDLVIFLTPTIVND